MITGYWFATFAVLNKDKSTIIILYRMQQTRQLMIVRVQKSLFVVTKLGKRKKITK